jgi:hypothetical protein
MQRTVEYRGFEIHLICSPHRQICSTSGVALKAPSRLRGDRVTAPGERIKIRGDPGPVVGRTLLGRSRGRRRLM